MIGSGEGFLGRSYGGRGRAGRRDPAPFPKDEGTNDDDVEASGSDPTATTFKTRPSPSL